MALAWMPASWVKAMVFSLSSYSMQDSNVKTLPQELLTGLLKGTLTSIAEVVCVQKGVRIALPLVA